MNEAILVATEQRAASNRRCKKADTSGGRWWWASCWVRLLVWKGVGDAEGGGAPGWWRCGEVWRRGMFGGLRLLRGDGKEGGGRRGGERGLLVVLGRVLLLGELLLAMLLAALLPSPALLLPPSLLTSLLSLAKAAAWLGAACRSATACSRLHSSWGDKRERPPPGKPSAACARPRIALAHAAVSSLKACGCRKVAGAVPGVSWLVSLLLLLALAPPTLSSTV